MQDFESIKLLHLVMERELLKTSIKL